MSTGRPPPLHTRTQSSPLTTDLNSPFFRAAAPYLVTDTLDANFINLISTPVQKAVNPELWEGIIRELRTQTEIGTAIGHQGQLTSRLKNLDEVLTEVKKFRTHVAVGVIGCTAACGKGTVVQTLTGASSCASTDHVGTKILPMRFQHNKSAVEPTMSRTKMSQLIARIKTLCTKTLMPGAARKNVPPHAAQALNSLLGFQFPPPMPNAGDLLLGAELLETIRWCHESVGALIDAGQDEEIIIEKVLDIKFDVVLQSTTSGDALMERLPVVECCFPWLEDVNIPDALFSIVDLPLDRALSHSPDQQLPPGVSHRPLYRLCSGVATMTAANILVSRFDDDLESAPPAQSVTSRPIPTQNAIAASAPAPPDSASVIRAVVKAAVSFRARKDGTEFDEPDEAFFWLPTAHRRVPFFSIMTGYDRTASASEHTSAASIVQRQHVQLRQAFGVFVPPSRIFVVSTTAAQAAIQMQSTLSNVRGSFTAVPKGSLLHDVPIEAPKALRQSWIWAVGGKEEVWDHAAGLSSPEELHDATMCNNLAWRRSGFGALISTIMKRVCTHTLLRRRFRLTGRVSRNASALLGDFAQGALDVHAPNVDSNVSRSSQSIVNEITRTRASLLACRTGVEERQQAVADLGFHSDSDEDEADRLGDEGWGIHILSREGLSDMTQGSSDALRQSVLDMHDRGSKLWSLVARKAKVITGTAHTAADTVRNAQSSLSLRLATLTNFALGASWGAENEVLGILEAYRAWHLHLADASGSDDLNIIPVVGEHADEEALLRYEVGIPEICDSLSATRYSSGTPLLDGAISIVSSLAEDSTTSANLVSLHSKMFKLRIFIPPVPIMPNISIRVSPDDPNQVLSGSGKMHRANSARVQRPEYVSSAMVTAEQKKQQPSTPQPASATATATETTTAPPSAGSFNRSLAIVHRQMLRVNGLEDQASRQLHRSYARAVAFVQLMDRDVETMALEARLLAFDLIMKRMAGMDTNSMSQSRKSLRTSVAPIILQMRHALVPLENCRYAILTSVGRMCATTAVAAEEVAERILGQTLGSGGMAESNATSVQEVLRYIARQRDRDTGAVSWRLQSLKTMLEWHRKMLDAQLFSQTAVVLPELHPSDSFLDFTRTAMTTFGQTHAGGRSRGILSGGPMGSTIPFPPPKWQKENRKKVVLCFCGGGVRGVISAMLAEKLDLIAQQKYKLRLWDICDEAIGTSTGAIIAALLACGTEPAQFVKLYKDEAEMIFPSSLAAGIRKIRAPTEPRYESGNRRVLARKYIGDVRLNDPKAYPSILRPKLLTFELATRTTRPFTVADDIPVVEVLMAATAAPTFFPAHLIGDHYYCDAGLTENHPGLQALEEAEIIDTVVTIGTGEPNPDTESLSNAGLVLWAKNIADVIIDGGERIARKLLASRFDKEHNFHFNPLLPNEGKIDIDDVRTISRMVALTEEFLVANDQEMVRAVDAMFRGTHPSSGGV